MCAEIHSINEQCDEFASMIHGIGLQLKSTAVCMGIRRLRYGHFDVSHALLRQQWTLGDVVDNLRHNATLLTSERLAGEANVKEIVGDDPGDGRKQLEG